MSAEEDFLARWSRRKREVEEAAGAAPVQDTAAHAKKIPQSETENKTAGPEAEFDLASLPPLESITSASDVTMFLRAGVPMELTRAALRRAWTADPLIRDFIGLAENAWDFTKTDEIAGFGPIGSAEDVAKLLEQVIGKPKPEPGQAAPVISADAPPVPANTNDSSVIDPPPGDAFGQIAQDRAADMLVTGEGPRGTATDGRGGTEKSPEAESPEDRHQLLRRTHGGALPQ